MAYLLKFQSMTIDQINFITTKFISMNTKFHWLLIIHSNNKNTKTRTAFSNRIREKKYLLTHISN